MSKVWFVTGSSRGWGRAIVEAALKAGDQVVATARKPEQLDDLVIEYGDHVRPVALDVTDAAQAERAVREAVEAFGRLDIVVNNAGYGDTAAVEDVTLEDFRRQIDTNFYGVVHVSKAVVPLLREQGCGHILQVSSLASRVSGPGLAAYQSAKWAVGGFSTALALFVTVWASPDARPKSGPSGPGRRGGAYSATMARQRWIERSASQRRRSYLTFAGLYLFAFIVALVLGLSIPAIILAVIGAVLALLGLWNPEPRPRRRG